jgi:F0F1-type ATP synthase alpha subunit
MKHSASKQIDGVSVEVVQFTATEGLLIAQKLMKLFSSGASEVIGSFDDVSKLSNVMDMDISGDVIGRMVKGLADQLEGEGTVDLIKRMLLSTKIDGVLVGGQFDTLFMGRFGTLFKILGFVIKVNFANFSNDDAGSQ